MLHERWKHQLYAAQEIPRRILAGERRICVTSPTGGGKTTMIADLIEWGLRNAYKPVVYTNRRLLVSQLATVLRNHGIELGVRAANHQDQRELAVQVSSLPTERSRVLKAERWQLHGHGERALAIVDEAHLNAGPTAQTILARHLETGGCYVGFTATPIGIAHTYGSLIVAGTVSELRACGALVPAYHFGPDEPDMRKFRPSVKTGEYTEGDIRKAIMTKAIFGRVHDWYRKLNPEQRPTILFAPGVKESIWFAEQLTAAGIRAAHIDGEGVWLDGEYMRTSDREAILREVRDGTIRVLCNRFVLREGLDLPNVSHIILATVMGGLGTYLQSAGRGLRACAGKDRLTIQDHGGHWWRHGSVNVDREWNLQYAENVIAGLRQEAMREHRTVEPIVCPRCAKVRPSGAECPQCGYVSTRRSRFVMQQDGQLREHSGDIYKPRRVKEFPNTFQLWQSQYHRARNSKNHMTFRQAEALFFLDNHYYPPRTLPLMPIEPLDWFLPCRSVPKERLRA